MIISEKKSDMQDKVSISRQSYLYCFDGRYINRTLQTGGVWPPMWNIFYHFHVLSPATSLLVDPAACTVRLSVAFPTTDDFLGQGVVRVRFLVINGVPSLFSWSGACVMLSSTTYNDQRSLRDTAGGLGSAISRPADPEQSPGRGPGGEALGSSKKSTPYRT